MPRYHQKEPAMIRRLTLPLLLLAGLLTFTLATHAAAPPAIAPAAPQTGGQWASTYGGTLDDVANDIWQTGDGGLAVAGTTSSFGVSGSDAWVYKVNTAGTVTWSETFGGVIDEYANALQQTGDGGLAVVGTSGSFGVGIHDYWVIRLHADGSLMWQTTYGGTQHNHAFAIQETADLGFIIVGETTSFGAGNRDAWVVRLDSGGNVLWQTVYGQSGWDIARGVAQTTDGGFVFVGYTSSFGAGNWDVWAVKLDANGVVQWQKTFGGAGDDLGWAVKATDDGGVTLAGETSSFSGNADFWVMKLAANGSVNWQKRYGGAGADVARALARTGDGGYLVAGETASFGGGGKDFWLLKLTQAGDVVWQRGYGGAGDEIAFSVRELSDGVGIAGSSTSFGAGMGDAWLLKLDAQGLMSDCALITTTNAMTVNTTVGGVNSSALVQNTAASVGPSSAVLTPRAVGQATQCSAPGPCQLDLTASYNGAQLALTYDIYTGPTAVTWQNYARVQGNWISLWSASLPAGIVYQNTISFNFPQVGNVPIYTRLTTPNGPVCTDVAVVNTGP